MNQQRPDRATVELRCPRCHRFMAEVRNYGRSVCKDCGSELTYRSREDRDSSGRLRVLTAS